MKKFFSLILALAMCVTLLPLSTTASAAVDAAKVVVGTYGVLTNGFYVVETDESLKDKVVKKVETEPADSYLSYEDGTLTVHGSVSLGNSSKSIVQVTSGKLTLTGAEGSALTLENVGAPPLTIHNATVLLDGAVDLTASCNGGNTLYFDSAQITLPPPYGGGEEAEDETFGNFESTENYTGDITLTHGYNTPVIGGNVDNSSVNLKSAGTVKIGKTNQCYAFISVNSAEISAKNIVINGMISVETFKAAASEDITFAHTGYVSPMFSLVKSVELSAKGDITLTQGTEQPLFGYYSSEGDLGSFTIKDAENFTLTGSDGTPTICNCTMNVIDCKNVTIVKAVGEKLLENAELNVKKNGKRGGKVLIKGGDLRHIVSDRMITVDNYHHVEIQNYDKLNDLINVTVDGEDVKEPTVTNCDRVDFHGNGGARTTFYVTFDTQGGSKIDRQIYGNASAKVTQPADPTRSGYTFKGWYTDEDCTNAWDFENDTVTEGVYLYAKWEKKGTSGGNRPSGSAPSQEPDFSPSVKPSAGGTTEVSGDSPSEGDLVTVITKPDDGKRVEKITVTDANGKQIEIVRSGDGTFSFTQPDSEVTIEVIYTDKPKFDDVGENSWYFEAVNFAVENGLMNGMSSNKFAPQTEITRGMFVTVLYNMAGKPSVERVKFADVADGRYYTDAISWAATSGIAQGVGGNRFMPESSITREEMVTMLWNFAGKPSTNGVISGFSDSGKVSNWAKNAFAWAIETEVVNGKGNAKLDPRGTATRAEAATVLMKFMLK